MWWTIPISWAARRDKWVICHFLKTKSLLGSPNNITKKDIKQLVSILKLWNKWVKRLMLTYNWPFLCMDKGGILRKDLTFVLSRCGPILIFFFCGSSFFTSSTVGKKYKQPLNHFIVKLKWTMTINWSVTWTAQKIQFLGMPEYWQIYLERGNLKYPVI